MFLLLPSFGFQNEVATKLKQVRKTKKRPLSESESIVPLTPAPSLPMPTVADIAKSDEKVKKKKQKIISTGTNMRSGGRGDKLYCICRQPYDESQ